MLKVKAKVEAVNSSETLHPSAKLQSHYLEDQHLNFDLRKNLKYIPALKSLNTGPTGLQQGAINCFTMFPNRWDLAVG
jgi:hypothetical protein